MRAVVTREPPGSLHSEWNRSTPYIDEMSPLKTSASDRSDAVIVSFDAKWIPQILRGKVRVVIRKQEPKPNPNWLYVYAKRPMGELVARAQIDSIIWMSPDQLIPRLGELGFGEELLREYTRGKEVCCYNLGVIEVASERIPVEALRETYAIHPPTHHMFLTPSVKEAIDKRAGFSHSGAIN